MQHVIVFCLENQLIADQIAKDFAKGGIQLEKRGLLDNHSLTTLQQAVTRPEGKILLLITDNFLKAPGCMYGSMAALREWSDAGQLIPVVTDGRLRKPDGGWEVMPTSFERVSNIIQYMNHWQDQYLELRKEKRHRENDPSLDQQLEITKVISSEIGEFLRHLRNLPWYPLDQFKADHYKIFRQLAKVSALLGDENKSTPETPAPVEEPGVSGDILKQKTLAEIIQDSGDELIAENAELQTKEELVLEKTTLSSSLHDTEPPTPTEEVPDDLSALLEMEEEHEFEGAAPDHSSIIPPTSSPDEEEEESELVFVGEDPDHPEEFDLESLFDDEETNKQEKAELIDEIEDEEQILLDLVSDDEEGLIFNADGKDLATPEEILDHAIDLLENDQQAAGIQYLKKTVEFNPDDNRLRYYYAYALARYGNDYKASASQLETVLAKDREYADAWFLLAEIAENEGKTLEAKHYFEKTLQVEPGYPEANYRFGLLILQHFEGQQAVAAEYFKKAVMQDKKNASAHYILATLLNEQLNDPEKAIKHFKKTLKYQPDHPFVYYDLALLYHQQGERALASHYYDKATLINPELKNEQNDKAFHFEPASKLVEQAVEDATLESQAGAEDLDTAGDTVTEAEELAVEIVEEAMETVPEVAVLSDSGELEAETEVALESVEVAEEVAGEEKEPATEAVVDDQVTSTESNVTEGLEMTATRMAAIIAETITESGADKLDVTPVEVVSELTEPAPEEEQEEETEEEEILTSLPVLPVQTKTVLVSGATSGIGKATAEIFARKGYRVIITGRRTERLEQIKQDFKEKFNQDILTLHFDVRNLEAVKLAIEHLPEEWKDVDILINNAGLSRGLDPIHEGDIEHWETMIDTNIKGLLYLTRAITPHMVKRRSGHVINIASSAGKEVYPGGNVYCASKFAVDALTKAMRLDLYAHNIRVSQVAPGHVEETEFAPVRFDWDLERAAKVYENFQPLKASDVAEVIFFIATRPAHVNIQDVLMFGTQQAGSTFIDRSGRG